MGQLRCFKDLWLWAFRTVQKIGPCIGTPQESILNTKGSDYLRGKDTREPRLYLKNPLCSAGIGLRAEKAFGLN